MCSFFLSFFCSIFTLPPSLTCHTLWLLFSIIFCPKSRDSSSSLSTSLVFPACVCFASPAGESPSRKRRVNSSIARWDRCKFVAEISDNKSMGCPCLYFLAHPTIYGLVPRILFLHRSQSPPSPISLSLYLLLTVALGLFWVKIVLDCGELKAGHTWSHLMPTTSSHLWLFTQRAGVTLLFTHRMVRHDCHNEQAGWTLLPYFSAPAAG